MSGRRRVLVLALIMIGACATVMLAMTVILYRHNVQEQGELLQITAQSQARLIEAIARHDLTEASMLPEGDPRRDSFKETLKQVIDAHGRSAGFLRTGEFTLARREGDSIVFLTRHRLNTVERPPPVRFDSNLAEPMRRALRGMSGVMIGLDYRGGKVLAAHEPVGVLDLGIVAKVDMAEIRAPFIVSGLAAAAAALAVVLAGTALFFRIGNPMVERLEQHARDLEQEIEERELAQERLGRFAHIVSISNDLLALVDEHHVYVAANDTYLQAHAKTLDEVIGHTVMELFGEEFFNAVIKPRSERCLAGEYVRHQDWFDMRGIGRVYMDATLSPYRGPQGEIRGFAIAARDITELKRVEDALRASEREFRIVTDGVPALIGYVDADRRYQFTNKAFETWLGVSRQESRGRFVWEIHGDDGYADLKPAVDHVFLGRRTRVEKFFPDSKKGPIHLHGDLVPDLNAKGEVSGCFVLLTVRQERRLAEMQAAVGILRDQLEEAGLQPAAEDPLKGVTREWSNPDPD